ncbi:hypothetical protein NSK_006366 [Nannochloropsis salina CCMP1776]|uniref:SET domain-containing protein n=1 Tax=Nannochloropsis salina CCMP1776 TaxID=1027361 RepID=A0A4D9CTQ3_9STRA|nr:hypothetical protein NSK_006366 [Nannochloropsis salina CCMP1776]|eukprot:TFJ82246.1 hypothetical protein NSK_006366 [Nannochloropsis salina CCMP1776]
MLTPLPCVSPPPSSGLPPLPLLPSTFRWVDSVVLPSGTHNRRLHRRGGGAGSAGKGQTEGAEAAEGCGCDGESRNSAALGSNAGKASIESIHSPSTRQKSDQDQSKGDPTTATDTHTIDDEKGSNNIDATPDNHDVVRHRMPSNSGNPVAGQDADRPLSPTSSPSSSTASSFKFEFECSSSCRCLPDQCQLRPTQASARLPLSLGYLPKKGWGVFFSPPPSCAPARPPSLPPHTFVAEYTGELISTVEARRRLAIYDEVSALSSLPPSHPSSLPPSPGIGKRTSPPAGCTHAVEHVKHAQGHGQANAAPAEVPILGPCPPQEGDKEESGGGRVHAGPRPHYLLTLLEEGDDFYLRTSLDATHCGNVSRFFNHSCDPNMYLVCVRNGGLLPRLCFFTQRRVHAGDELTFAYGEREENHASKGGIQDESGARFGRSCAKGTPLPQSQSGRPCWCGSEKCVGNLPYQPGL